MTPSRLPLPDRPHAGSASAAPFAAPEFREWCVAAVRLLQGVINHDDGRVWETVLASRSQIESYLARLGLVLVVDEGEGYAYVRQWTENECPTGYEQLPKLVRRQSLGYSATVLAVLLREVRRRFEDDDLHNERCVIELEEIMDQWRGFFPQEHDEYRQKREFMGVLGKLEALGFVRKFSDNPESWEVRPILKARLPVAELERLKQQLVTAAALRRAGGRGTSEEAEDGSEGKNGRVGKRQGKGGGNDA